MSDGIGILEMVILQHFKIRLQFIQLPVSIMLHQKHGTRQVLNIPWFGINILLCSKVPKADFQLSSSKICLGENLNLSSTSTLGDTAISKYSWDFGDGSVRSTNPLTYKYQKDGKYTISLVITDFNGCTDKKIVNQAIDVLPKPKASFTMDSAYDCEVPTVIPFRNQSTGNGITYKWSFEMVKVVL